MIRSAGLEPLRGELRHARMGQWRYAVYFAAAGAPLKMTFDDGSRGCSEAFFQEASPPPWQTALPTAPKGGAAPASSSVWAGPRQQSRPPPGPPAPQHRAAPAEQRPLYAATSPSGPALLVATGRQEEIEVSLKGRSGYGRRQEPRSDELEELRGLIQDLRAELRALRRENELLRRAQVLDPWRLAAQSQPTQRPTTPPALLPLPNPSFSPVPPMNGDVAMDHSALGVHAREQGGTPEPKRALGVARALVVEGRDDE